MALPPKPAKKLIAVTGDEDQKKLAERTMASAMKKVFKSTDLVMDGLKGALKHNLANEFTSPIVVSDAHVRHFFAKLSLGVRPLQDYIGKVLNTREEAIEFFLNYVGKKAFGEDWLLKQVSQFIEYEKEGLFLITDLTLDQAKRLKRVLNSSLVVLFMGESTTEKVDQVIKQQNNPTSMRRITSVLIEKLTNVTNRRTQNDRITQSEL